MTPTFLSAFTSLIGNEGGYVNNPKDPGGETMYGVTARVARAHGYTGAMRDLPLETAQQIAKAEYWDKFRCDDFDPRIAFEIFDTAYNGGYPIKWLQLAVAAKPDGKLGPATVAAVQGADPMTVIARFNAYRLSYYTSLKTWPDFGRGWANRIAHNLLLGAK
ncbi:MAG TPA: glycosyl hydrolase 108 family protein [Rhodocyclaceae bacterium]|nr:glycosyl hydrolase 108 family protein [Rhodocyclaceae bacterium]